MAKAIQQTELVTLKDFYQLMEATREVRFEATKMISAGEAPAGDTVLSLKNALSSLEAVAQAGGKRVLSLDGSRKIELDLDYEINETRKDIFFLENGEKTFMGYLADLHPEFEEHVARGRNYLGGREINCFITDRDGTVNNYCGRYRSSIQSIYNAVLLTRFAQSSAANSVILTSAPLANIGLVDISVAPERVMYYAGSKGRECIDLEGRRRAFPVEKEKQALLDKLNAVLSGLVKMPEYEKYSLIGSGLQFKFGQTTIARQDISKSVDEQESRDFLRRLGEVVADLDPDGTNFRIEDTGLDVEIILTIESGDEGPKDFDKGDGVRFLNTEFNFGMFHGPNLICGDTGSDVPMLEAAMEMSKETKSIFVTSKDELATRVKGVCPDALIVPEPDMLVTILGTLT
ncbi:trehalose 6-phosphate synthase [Salidesulfovibrio onnuriiensis]|uniref:trehalose 6-phosphate synthase n=1 Tax=Salidesulfovibrio onnuriiensis TaxID=2583823 RepID=UPI0011CC7B84|nr:trehalose 6-phosphate synthase [Salidesulfovibrio onnuriiensis]